MNAAPLARPRALPLFALIPLACAAWGAPGCATPPKVADPPPAAPAAEDAPAARSQVVTQASGVRVRATPSVEGEILKAVGLGVVLDVSGQVSNGDGAWLQVSAPGGAQGFAAAGLTRPWDPNEAAAIQVSLIEDRLALAAMLFEDRVDLARFAQEVTDAHAGQGDWLSLELLRLRAYHAAAAAVGYESADNRAWAEAHQGVLVYSEPAGEWFVNSQVAWDAEAAHHDDPAAEPLAWFAANLPLAGECEGYFPCDVSLERWTLGNYLDRHPHGAHAEAALRQLEEDVVAMREGFSDEDLYGDKEAAMVSLQGLRETVAGVGEAGATTLAAVDELMARVKVAE